MYIIKLGGSVITDKAKEFCFKKEIMDNLAKQIKKANKEIILVHGAGSFGHILAKRYNLNDGYKNSDQIKGFCFTQSMVQNLNSLVLKSLHKHGIPAVSIPPHAIIKLDDHNLLKIDYEIFRDCIKNKSAPIAFGDVVLDKTLGFSICSGDLLMQTLSQHFSPEKAIFVIDEDGLYTSNPKKDKNAELIEEVSIANLENLTISLDAHADVTGGMKGKIETIKNITKNGTDVVLLNGNKPDRLYRILVGEKTKHTIVYGDKK